MAKNAKVEDFVSDLIGVCVIAKVEGTRGKIEKRNKKDEVTQEAVEAVKAIPARLDGDKLFALAQNNNIDIEKYRADVDTAAGRIRMTVGNMLRARAHRRHGLFDVNGDWNSAPEGFLAEGNDEPTETAQGEKIAKPKPAKEETTEE